MIEERDFLILTETPFFQHINVSHKDSELAKAYQEFVHTVINLCCQYNSYHSLALAMTYVETELQFLFEDLQETEEKKKYIRKALLFIQKTLECAKYQLPLQSTPKETKQPSSFQWSSSTVELVELIYGLTEMKSINNGETSVIELADFLSNQFGIKIKDCYSAYVDIKRRKNESRTYFLDKMQERLNRRMQLDDEKD